jgi:uncharacterized tellurite resistance protein B-like protein
LGDDIERNALSLRDLLGGRRRNPRSVPDADPVLSFEIRIGTDRRVVQATHLAYPSRTRRKADASPDDCWHPLGVEATVAGRTLDGLVYVGRDLGPVNEQSYSVDIEPSLIDPTLPVAAVAQGSDLTAVWPLSYEQLDAGQRAAYLNWLAGGRQDPRIGTAYVELFAAGLERRALADRPRSSAADGDLDSILSELARLLDTYKDQRQSARLQSLVDVLRAPKLEGQIEDIEPPTERLGWDSPLELRLALGVRARNGTTLPVEWALSWVRCSRYLWLRTPAIRCPAEFAELFSLRYQERYPKGLKLKDIKQRITLEHRPINVGFRNAFRWVSELPDVVGAGHIANPLRRLAESCTDELDAYSRFLGRQPDAEDDLRALALLPRELLRTRGSELLDELRGIIAQLGDSQHYVTQAEALIAVLAGPAGKIAKKDAVSLARLLSSLEVGIEPDVRFGSDMLGAGGSLVLFRLSATAAGAPTPEYSAAAALVYMAVAVAASDDTVSPDEEHLLRAHVLEALGLEQDERARLAAYLKWLLLQPPSLRGISSRVSQIPEGQRNNVAAALLAIAGADGVVTPSEVRVLTKLFSAMGLEEALLYTQLHAMAADPSNGPITVRSAGPGDPEYALPRVAPEGSIVLNRAVISARLAETATVSALLAGIFASDEPPAAPVVESERVHGLDHQHYAFLRRLGEHTAWTRAEVESAAADLQLLPDGALETINEVAFESVGAPVWHGEDPLEIDASVVKEMMS